MSVMKKKCTYTYKGITRSEEEMRQAWIDFEYTDTFCSGSSHKDHIYENDKSKFYGIVFDEDGSITQPNLKEGIKTDTFYGLNLPRLLPEIDKKRHNRLAQQKFKIVLNKLKSTFPQLNFIEEDNKSMKEKGLDRNLRGWVDKDGIHFNIDKVKLETPFHEMQHIWNEIIRLQDPELYKQMYDFLDGEIAKGRGNDFHKMYMGIARKYRTLDHARLMDELMATIGGLRGEKSMEQFFLTYYADYASDFPMFKRLWGMISEWVNNIATQIKRFFLGARFAPDMINRRDYIFEKFFDDLREEVMAGNTQHTFTSDEMEVISHVFAQSMNLDLTSIEDIMDIASMLNSKKTDPTKMTKLDEEKLTEHVFNNIKRQSHGDYKWKIGNRTYEFDREKFETDDEGLRDAIRSTVVKEYTMFEQQIRPKMMEFVKRVNTLIATHGTKDIDTSITQIADEVFGEGKFKDRIMREFSVIIGLHYKIKEILPYSELKNHENPNVKALYNPAFVGFDPLVVIHEDDQDIDISLLDITSKPLGELVGTPYDNNIFSDIMSDTEFVREGGSSAWSSKAFNLHNLMLTLQLMAMKKANNKVRIQKIGTVQLNANQVKNHLIVDIAEAVNQIKILASRNSVLERVRNEDIKALLMDPKVYSVQYVQSWVAQMDNYIRYLADELDLKNPGLYGIKTIAQKQRDYLFSDDVKKEDQIKIYRKRQLDIETRLGKSAAYLDDPEYKMLSNAIRQLRTGEVNYLNSTKDMSRVVGKFMNSYNLNSDILQWVVEEAMTAKNMVVDKFMKVHKDVFDQIEKVKDEYLKGHHLSHVTRLARDKGDDYFADCIKTTKGRLTKDTTISGKQYKAGDLVDIVLPNMVMKESDKEKSKSFTNANLELNKKVWQYLRERWIDNMYYEFKSDPAYLDELGNVKITREKIADMFDSDAEIGMIPVIERSINSFITSGDLGRGGDFVKGFQKIGKVMSHEGEFFDDLLGKGTDEELLRIHSILSGQRDAVKRYEKAGLRWNETAGEYEVLDYEQNAYMSTNLERILNYFMLDGIRTEVYGERLIPIINNAHSLFLQLEEGGISQENNKRYLDEFTDRVVYRKSKDVKHDMNVKILGKNLSMAATVRTMLKGFSNAALYLKASVAGKNVVFNTIHQGISSLSRDIANIGIPPEMRDVLPSDKSVMEATAKALSTDFRKARLLALHFQIINRSERELLESPTLNASIRYNVLTEGTGYILSQYGDMGARVVGMTSWMINEGSWDAYDIDPETGDIIYDITKDKRYYTDGKQTKEQESLVNALKERLIDQGQMKRGEKVPVGHDWTMVNNTMKWYTDKFIIAGIDDLTKAMLSNSYIGALFTQFRMFNMDSLNNIGLGADNKLSTGGSVYKTVTDENGNIVTIKEKREFEGIFQSINASLNDLLSLRKMSASEIKSFAHWWRNIPAQRRYNLSNAMLRLFLWGGLTMMFKEFLDDKERQQTDFALNDIVYIAATMDWMQNPIPLAAGILTFFKTISGNNPTTVISRYTGGIGETYKMFMEED